MEQSIPLVVDGKESVSGSVGQTLRALLQDVYSTPRKDVIAARVFPEDKVYDLFHRLTGEVQRVDFLTVQHQESLKVLRHSAAHITAQAIMRHFPGTKLAVGPPTEDGFYYDIDCPQSLSPEDLEKVQAEIAKIAAEQLDIVRLEKPKTQAICLAQELGQLYKVELLEKDIPEDVVSFYQQGEFIDLCEGPHVPNTRYLEHVKLFRVTGAYWRGNEKNRMLQRVYGTAFFSKKDLQEYLQFLEEAKKRDHRRLGKELDLFSIHEEVGPGLVFWHPKGAWIRHRIEELYKKELLRRGYEFLYTPHVARGTLWQTSGHLNYYRDNMYPAMDLEHQEYFVKPMNCPGHIMVYRQGTRSYRDLPLRYAELGTVYRYERSGVVQGLFRVRGLTQDDAHIFCREEQVQEEIEKLLDFVLFFWRIFGFSEFIISLSTKPEKYVGRDENWEKATQALRAALEQKKLAYHVDEGEGAFYGPKIDFQVKDSLGRPWQCSTIQVDFNLPERFSLAYAGQDGHEHVPVMIHRAILGSLERTFGILIEHYAGAFPFWLAPVQGVVMSVLPEDNAYAQEVYEKLRQEEFRVQLDTENEPISGRIRKHSLQKVPYMAVVGSREREQGTVAIRERGKGNLGAVSLSDFIKKLKEQDLKL